MKMNFRFLFYLYYSQTVRNILGLKKKKINKNSSVLISDNNFNLGYLGSQNKNKIQ